MSENSPYRQGTDPMEVINRRIDNTNIRIDEARFEGNIEEVDHYKAELEQHQALGEEMSSYLQERPLRKVEKGDQLYDQTQGKSLEEFSRDELVSKWAEAEDAGDVTQSSDVQDEIERRLDSEKNMSDDLKMRMIDRLYSQKEDLKKNKAENSINDGDLLEVSQENDSEDQPITEPRTTPPVFTGKAPESPLFETDDVSEVIDVKAEEKPSEEDELFIRAESDINDGRLRPFEHPDMIAPGVFSAEAIDKFYAPEPQNFPEPEEREVVENRSFADKLKDAKARVFATVTSSWMKTKDFFKEIDEEGNERVNKKKVGVAAGIGVLAVGVAGAVLYAKFGMDKPRGGGNAMDSMESAPKPKVGPNGTEGAVQISEPSNPGVVSVPKGGIVETAMPAPKPSVNLEQAPWNVAHELAPGDELSKINETIEKFNNLSGSNLRLNQVGDTVQIYNGNRALTPEQQQFFNEILSQNL